MSIQKMAKQFTFQSTVPRTQYWLTVSGIGLLSLIAVIWGGILVNQYVQDQHLRKQYGPVVADLVENDHLKNLNGEKRIVDIQKEVDANQTPSNADFVFLSNIITGPEDRDAQVDAMIAIDVAAENGLMSDYQKRYVAFATISVLQSQDDRLRAKESSLLGKLNTKSIIPKLVALQNDPDDNVRYFAQKSLKSLGYTLN